MGVSIRLAYVRRDTKKFLFSYLNIVLKKGDWGEVARVRQQLKGILQQECMGFVVRSRYKENLETEMASLFHANRENKNFFKNNHNELRLMRTYLMKVTFLVISKLFLMVITTRITLTLVLLLFLTILSCLISYLGLVN